VHIALAAQLIEQLLVQVMSQVEPAAHDTLPLPPTVTLHDALAAQSMLHDSPHVPSHVESIAQSSEQLLPHTSRSMPHDVPAAQLQLAPVQSGGGGAPPPPQAAASEIRADRIRTRILRRAMWRHYGPSSIDNSM